MLKYDRYVGIFCVCLILAVSLVVCSTTLAEDTQSASALGLSADAQYDESLYLESIFTRYQPYLKNLGVYKPLYFLLGTNLSKSKFQISFKYKFYNPVKKKSFENSFKEGFYFGYTQTSFWDLKSDSKPFDDTSYKPELFFLSSDLYTGSRKHTSVLLQLGYQHESNGKSEENSRSTNHIYLEPNFIFYQESSSFGLQIAPKIWTYVENSNETNEDLCDYRGYFDLGVKMGYAEKLVVDSHFRSARKGNSYEINFTYPMNINNIELYLNVQYANALAESLIDYKNRTEALRIGFSFVR